jgi:hypothetical protein
MYKFTNGVVVFTEEDKENFLKAGYILEKEKENGKDDDRIIETKPRESNKKSSRFRR